MCRVHIICPTGLPHVHMFTVPIISNIFAINQSYLIGYNKLLKYNCSYHSCKTLKALAMDQDEILECINQKQKDNDLFLNYFLIKEDSDKTEPIYTNNKNTCYSPTQYRQTSLKGTDLFILCHGTKHLFSSLW